MLKNILFNELDDSLLVNMANILPNFINVLKSLLFNYFFMRENWGLLLILKLEKSIIPKFLMNIKRFIPYASLKLYNSL